MFVRRRGKSYEAVCKKKGYGRKSKTFKTKHAAKAWGTKTQGEMDDHKFIDTRESRSVLMENIIDDLIYSFERFGLAIAGPKVFHWCIDTRFDVR